MPTRAEAFAFLQTEGPVLFRGARSMLYVGHRGMQPQGKDVSDPEFHHWTPAPGDFVSIGMEARTFGKMFVSDASGFRGAREPHRVVAVAPGVTLA